MRGEADVSAQRSEVEEKGVGVPRPPEWGALPREGCSSGHPWAPVPAVLLPRS